MALLTRPRVASIVWQEGKGRERAAAAEIVRLVTELEESIAFQKGASAVSGAYASGTQDMRAETPGLNHTAACQDKALMQAPQARMLVKPLERGLSALSA